MTAPVAAWPDEDWWTDYGDPQLTHLIQAGLSAAPTVAIAQARLDRAEALVGAARAVQAPALTANGAIAEAKPSYNTGLPTPPALRGYNDTGRLALDFSYELDLWGKNRAAVAAALSEAAATKADLAAARLIVSTSIAAAYAELARLASDRDVLVAGLAVREQTLALVRRRLEAGYDGQSELRLAEAGPPAARAEIQAVDEQAAIARLRLVVLMGGWPDQAEQIAPPAIKSLRSFGLPPAIPAELIGRRPDLAAARLRTEAAARRIDVARAAFYPNVNLLGLIGVQALGVGNLANAGSDLGSAGLAVSLPIFDGGRRKAGARAARADFDAAVGAYDAALNTALGEVAEAVTSQRALERRLADSREALAALTQGWALSERRYRAGAVDFTAVLLAEDRMLAAQRVVSGLEARRFVLDLALVKALGGGWRATDLS